MVLSCKFDKCCVVYVRGIAKCSLLSVAFNSFVAFVVYSSVLCSKAAKLPRYQEPQLLELFASAPLRIAYDCAKKRFRAQFLCALSRAAEAEARRNDSCVRGSWQKALGGVGPWDVGFKDFQT